MKKRTIALSICLLSVAFLLFACGTNGEARAKKLGLNYIKKTFQMQETDVLKEYFKLATVTPLNDMYTKELVAYGVTVSDDQGEMLYYAVVNAKAREMILVQQSLSNLKLTEEEANMANEMDTSGIFSASKENDQPKKAARLAANWVQRRLEPNADISNFTAGQGYRKDGVEARAFFDTMIMIDNGKVYSATVCWPSMDVVQVTLLDS